MRGKDRTIFCYQDQRDGQADKEGPGLPNRDSWRKTTAKNSARVGKYEL